MKRGSGLGEVVEKVVGGREGLSWDTVEEVIEDWRRQQMSSIKENRSRKGVDRWLQVVQEWNQIPKVMVNTRDFIIQEAEKVQDKRI